MKNMTKMLLLTLIIDSCGGQSEKAMQHHDTDKTQKIDTNIFGFWRYFEDENVSIVIEHDSVYYPDIDKRYPYILKNDLLVVQIGIHEIDSIKYKMQGIDTLLFITADGNQVNVRNK